MNTNDLEVMNDYNEFCNSLSGAYNEQYFLGRISYGKAKNVSDTFGSIYSKFVNMELDLNSAILFCNVMSKMNDYNLRTGNSFDLGSGLFKIVFEKVTGGQK